MLQHAGEYNTKVYVVKKGLLRSYTIDKKGKEHIYMFAPEGWIIADSLPIDAPCELYIDALEDSEVYITEKDLENTKPDFAALVKRLSVLQHRIIMLMSATALERYKHFIETYPDILQRVPQKMVASYLGITPEALSKVKNENARSK